MRFGVAEAAVEFEHARAGLGEHQPGVEHADVGCAAPPHPIHRRLQHAPRDLVHQLRREVRRRTIAAHPAGIEAAVAVEGALVVAGGQHRDHRRPVTERQQGCLFAVQPRLDEHCVTRSAERALHHDLLERSFSLRARIAHEDALTCRQPIGLDDDRLTKLPQIRHCCVVIRKYGCGRGRDALFDHKLLGERLGAFQPRCGLHRPKGAQSRNLERIHDSRRQRHFRPDHRQVNRALLREGNQLENILCRNRHIRQLSADRPAIARRDEYVRNLRRLPHLPRQRVLPSPRTDDQNTHSSSFR